jgi:glycosyltransferase involved in cell wall biosynthesis
MRPDVTLVSPYPATGTRHSGVSGVASYTANLAHGLHDNGAAVTIVAPHETGQPHDSWDGPVRVLRRFGRGAAAVPAALAAARRTGAGVVHLQHELFLYGGPAGLPRQLLALRRPGPPTVLTMHQVVDPVTVDRHYTRLHRLQVPPVAARAALAVLQHTLPRLADATVVHEEAFRRVVPAAVSLPHGIETPALDRGAAAAARRTLGLPQDRLVVLCFGFLAPYKGLETALEAAGLAGPRVLLVVAGGDHPRLAEQRDTYGLMLRRTYGAIARFTGYVPDRDVSSWFLAADVAAFPYPSPHAASGALALALAHRTPALLSPELARTAAAPAVLAVPGGAAGLAARLLRLASEPAQLDRLRSATAAMADGRSWPAVARRHLDLYEGLIRDQNPARRRLRSAQPG